MRVLFDTHVLLWTLEDPRRLGAAARTVLAEDGTQIVVSVINVWEIAIKQSLGHLHAPGDLPEQVQRLGHEILDVRVEHAWQVRKLPLHHGDPFDRLLIAQAQIEDLPLVTHDRILERYDVRVIRA